MTILTVDLRRQFSRGGTILVAVLVLRGAKLWGAQIWYDRLISFFCLNSEACAVTNTSDTCLSIICQPFIATLYMYSTILRLVMSSNGHV